MPLAFAALPIYVHVPRLYAEGLGLSLALVGAVLLAARIVDAVTDPLIGWANDRLPRRRLWIALALPALGAGMLGLLVPPAGRGAAWLFGLLVAVAARLPMAAALGLTALFALTHGVAHGLELPALASPWGYAAGFVAATAALHGAGYALVRWLPQAAAPLVHVAGAASAGAGLWLLGS